MAAPTFVAGTELDGNISSGGTVSWAAGGVDDIIVVQYGAYQFSATTGTPTLSGFTAFGVRAGVNSSQFEASTGFLLKHAGTTAGGSGALTVPNAAAGQIDWISYRIAGGDTSVLAEAHSGAGGNNGTPTAPSLTSGGADRLEIIANFLNQPITVGYSGFTNFAQWSTSLSEGAWSKTVGAGATGSFPATTSTNAGWGLSNILIPPTPIDPNATATPVVLNTPWAFPVPIIDVPGQKVAAPTIRSAFSFPAETISVPAQIVSYVKEVGSVTNATATANAQITVAAGGVPVGDTVVVIGACDNTGASGIATTITVTDGKSNTYTTTTQAISDPGAAAAGVQTFIAYAPITTELVAGDLITITFGDSTTAKGIMAQQFHNVKLASPVIAENVANNLTGTASSVAATATAAGQLVVGATGIEGPTADTYTQDSDTTNGTWVGLTKRGSGTTTSGATIGAAYKITTASGAQSYDVTITSRDHSAKIVIFAVEGQSQSPSPDLLYTPWTFPPPTPVATGGNATATPPTLTTTWAYPAATVSISRTVTPAALNTAWTFPAPTVTAVVLATAAALNTAWAFPAATISAGATVAPAALNTAWTYPAATASTGGNPQPATLNTAWTFPAPTVTASKTVTPAALNTPWTYPAAAPSASRTATPAALNTPWTLPTPSALITPPLVNDDFTGSSIDLGQWVVYNRLSDQVNNEVNAVIPANVRVGSGTLKIDSKFETVMSGDTTTGAPNPRSVDYTSGQIAQRATAFLYGDIQVRAKIPGGIGLWPCIWMLGHLWQASQPFTANVVGHDWPNGGWWEADIAEFMFNHRTQVNNALHFVTANRGGSGEKALPFDATTRFMVYRLVWTATSMTWMVDAEDGVGWRTTLTISGAAGSVIPNTAAYLVIHTAIGGNAVGAPDSSTFPQTMEVDWARVTQGSNAASPAVLNTPWTFPALTVSIPATASPVVLSTPWTFPAPTASISRTVTPAALSTPWTYPAPAASGTANTAPAVLATPWTFPAPTVAAAGNTTATPATLVTAWTFPAAAVSIGRTATPATLATQWAYPAPAVSGTANTAPAALNTVWTYPAPSVASGTVPQPATLNTPWSYPAATISLSRTATPATLTTPWAYPAATGTISRTATPAALNTPWAFPAPTATGGATPTPATLTTTWSYPAPSVQASTPSSPAPNQLVTQWAYPAPTVRVSPSASPASLSTPWSYPAPTAATARTATPSVLATQWAYPAATGTIGQTPTPAALNTSWAYPAPTIAAAGNTTATPPTLNLQWTFPGPTESISRSATPPTLVTTWAFPSVVVSIGISAAPATLNTPWAYPTLTITVSPVATPATLVTQWTFPAQLAGAGTLKLAGMLVSWSVEANPGTSDIRINVAVSDINEQEDVLV